MKKSVLVVAGLAVLSTSAFASKARMEALGQGSTSKYIMDTRSVFLNPAAVNENKNYIITEWGTSQVLAADTTAQPRAEGGFFREMGAMSYGLYLGNDDSKQAHTGTFLGQSNALDLFVGGDMGMKWGARVHYANAKDETVAADQKKQNALGLGLGVSHGDFDAYVNTDLTDKSEGSAVSADSEKMKSAYQVGGSYKWSSWTFFADYDTSKKEKNLAAVASSNKEATIIVGAGRVHELNPTSRLFTDVQYQNQTQTIEGVGAGKVKTSQLPVTLGMEVDATSWLVVRGSVSQPILINEVKDIAGKKKTQANQTTVNGGATLNFGKLKVDGMVGTTSSAGVAETGIGDGKRGTLSTSNLLTKVGVSYWF